MENMIEEIRTLLAVYGLRIIAAIAIFIIGKWVAKFLRNRMRKMMAKKKMDEAIVSFVSSLVYIGLMVFIILAALSQIGVQVTSFIAVIGAAGLAIGLALQGSLANFAAGFLLIVFRPFKVGDYIESAGATGTVEKIEIFTTQLRTLDNRLIIIPNSKITSDNITNFTAKEMRRVDVTVGVSYYDNLDKVRSVLRATIDADSRVLKEPAPTIVVSELAESSVNFTVRAWVKTESYWDVYFETTEAIKRRFDDAGIHIPFPQTDMHIYKEAEITAF